MNLVLCFLPCSLSSESTAEHLKPSALVCVCMHVFVCISNTQRRKSPLHCRPEQWNPRGRLSCLSPSSAMPAMPGPNNLPKHIICHRLSMPCFALTKYSPQYAYALQFICALLLSKTYATALLYYFVLNATKLTKNLLLFAKLLYSTCAVQPNLTKSMPQLCNSVLHRTIRRLRIQVAASGSFCNGLIFFVRPVVIVH